MRCDKCGSLDVTADTKWGNICMRCAIRIYDDKRRETADKHELAQLVRDVERGVNRETP